MALLSTDLLILVVVVFSYIRLQRYIEATHKVLASLRVYVVQSESLDAVKQLFEKDKPKPKKRQQQPVEDGPATLKFNQARPVLVDSNFYDVLERVLSSGFLALAVFAMSEVSYCLIRRRESDGQIATTFFLCALVMSLLAELLGTLRATWNTENQLSLVFAILNFLAGLGLLGFLEKSSLSPGLRIWPGIEDAAIFPEEFKTHIWWIFTLLVASLGALFTCLVLLPGFRFSRAYLEATRPRQFASSSDDDGLNIEGAISTPKKIDTLFLHLQFLAPLIVVLLFVDPLTGNPFVETFSNGENEQEVRDMYRRARLYAILLLNTFRVGMVPRMTQAVVDSSFRVTEYILRHASSGHFSMMSLQTAIRDGSQSICAAGVQYAAPAVITLAFTLLNARTVHDSFGVCKVFWGDLFGVNRTAPETKIVWFENVMEKLAPEKFEMPPINIPSTVFEPLTNILIMWTSLIWFLSNFAGLMYWRTSAHGDTFRRFANVYVVRNTNETLKASSKKKR